MRCKTRPSTSMAIRVPVATRVRPAHPISTNPARLMVSGIAQATLGVAQAPTAPHGAVVPFAVASVPPAAPVHWHLAFPASRTKAEVKGVCNSGFHLPPSPRYTPSTNFSKFWGSTSSGCCLTSSRSSRELSEDVPWPFRSCPGWRTWHRLPCAFRPVPGGTGAPRDARPPVAHPVARPGDRLFPLVPIGQEAAKPGRGENTHGPGAPVPPGQNPTGERIPRSRVPGLRGVAFRRG